MSNTRGNDNHIIKLLDLIAQEESTHATDLIPLVAVVDTVALTRLLDSDSYVSVSFEYLGYRVIRSSLVAVKGDFGEQIVPERVEIKP